MTFRDLKLPKELSRKKKLQLHKVWILNENVLEAKDHGITIHPDKDRYGLSLNSAFELALNSCDTAQMFKEMTVGEDDVVSVRGNDIDKVIVVHAIITLQFLDDPITDPIGEHPAPDPQYNPERGYLTVTIKEKCSDFDLKNYRIDSFSFTVNSSTEEKLLKDLYLEEVVIQNYLRGE